jgi:predicted small lipoprotein YifL
MKKIALAAVVIGGALLVGGCGQKGPLYLPDKNAAVVTRPAGSTSPQQTPSTAPPPLPAPNQSSQEQAPQDRAPEPPPAPTTEGTTPKPPQDKQQGKDDSQSKSPPRNP